MDKLNNMDKLNLDKYLKIVNEYLNTNKIDEEKMKLCVEIMNHYYDGVIGIDNMFNVK